MTAIPEIDAADFGSTTAYLEKGCRLIPRHMYPAIRNYVLYGVPPGGFLTALLSNDFMGAAGKADDENAGSLTGWARFLCNYAPTGCYGSPAAVSAWVDAGGLRGARGRVA